MNNISKVRFSEKITNVVASVLALIYAPANSASVASVWASVAGAGLFSGMYQYIQQYRLGKGELNIALQACSKELLRILPEDTDTLEQIKTILGDVNN